MPDNRSAGMKLEIGGIVFAIELHGGDGGFVIGDVYRPFLSDKRPEAAFAVRYESGPPLRFTEKVFDSGGPWALYDQWGRWLVLIPSPSAGSQPYRIAVVDADFSKGDIYIAAREADQTPYPLEYPLEELVFINLLSRGRGVLLHACAVGDSDHGFIFAGTSGSGKSTMADLWKYQEGVTILSDDRVIVREKEGRLWAYGTPWHGDVKLCSPEKVPVDRVFVLRHGEENSAVPLKAPEALTSLFVRSFPTYWSPEGMTFTLEFLSRMSSAVPCYDLGFVPDRSVVNFVRAMGDA